MENIQSLAAFSQARDQLLELGESLKSYLTDIEAFEVEEVVLKDFRRNRFDIAVVGQIKAGKSTFLNAVTDKPDMLPTAVNPWTTVITRMHFGKPDGPECGGDFHFYSPDEWQAIIAQASPGEKVEELLSGIAGEETAQEVAQDMGEESSEEKEMAAQRREIVDRARARLGEELEAHLGMYKHEPEINRMVLERYLASGEMPDNPEQALAMEIGKYSAITREADLYFPRHPFEEYCTIVDTPGTNDPFRFREKITREYIGMAHAYVMVLAAQRAMDAFDVQTFRDLVTGLHKDRLIVYVNRIDNLNAPEREVERVLAQVNKTLKANFPNMEIPVVVGSAWWAEMAVRPDTDWVDNQLDWAKFTRYGVAKNLFSKEDAAKWRREPENHMPAIRDALMRASGIPEARATIGNVLLRERGVTLLRQAQNNLAAAAESFALMRADTAKQHEEMANVLEKGLESVSAEKENVGNRVAELTAQKEGILLAHRQSRNELDGLLHREQTRIHSLLRAVVERFAEQEANLLKSAGISIFGAREWKVSLQPCFMQIEESFLSSYAAARQQIVAKLQVIRDHLRRNLSIVDENLARVIDVVPPPEVPRAPSLSSMDPSVIVDLGNVVSRMFAGKKTREAKAKELRETILMQFILNTFEGSIRGLSSSARQNLAEAAERTMINFDHAIQRVFQQMEKALADLNGTLEKLETETDPEQAKAAIAEHRQLAQEYREHAALLEEMCAAVRSVGMNGTPIPADETLDEANAQAEAQLAREREMASLEAPATGL
jgi:signal recognition particle receptor subunit beta